MNRFIAVILCVVLVVSGCSSTSKKAQKTNKDESKKYVVADADGVDSSTEEIEIDAENEKSNEVTIKEDVVPSFKGLDDPNLLTYVTNNVYADLEYNLANEDYIIEDVETVYLSKEYVEELEYNSQSNVYFGYTLKELDDLFEGSRYIFTLGEDGQTDVRKMETVYDNTTEQVIKNVAIGSGVILICVTVSVVTAGAGAPAVSMVFAASAKTATTFALSSSIIGGAAATITTAYQTHNVEEAIDAGVLAASEGFKWGAITGALVGGAKEAIALRKAQKAAKAAEMAAENGAAGAAGSAAENGAVRTWQESEAVAQKLYTGDTQLSYLGGQRVPAGTAGATRPDIVRPVGGKLEAIEVKNYALDKAANRAELYRELEREIAARVENMPKGTLQRIVLDIQGRGYSEELLQSVTEEIWSRLANIYPKIPIDFI